jgi:hypothetical protein
MAFMYSHIMTSEMMVSKIPSISVTRSKQSFSSIHNSTLIELIGVPNVAALELLESLRMPSKPEKFCLALFMDQYSHYLLSDLSENSIDFARVNRNPNKATTVDLIISTSYCPERIYTSDEKLED